MGSRKLLSVSDVLKKGPAQPSVQPVLNAILKVWQSRQDRKRYLISFLSIVQELHDPVHGCQQTRPCVRASHSKQGALADLKRVLQVLKQLWNILLHLAKGFHVWVHLTHQELHYAEDVLAHGTGQCLGRHRMLIAMSAEVFYELPNAVVLICLVADRSRILLWSRGLLTISAGPPMQTGQG